uniref:Bet v I/Major latex protein domain-containing protein n=1 Tax=Kalanchoe fedtschenkoi TaxID=63787 RepID=A0A7N0VID1_KALFE
MSQLRKLGFQAELKTSAAKFFEFMKSDLGNIAQIFPQHVKCLQLIEGNFSTTGSVILFKYTIGDMLKVYNSAKVKFQVADGSAKWELVFEKANEAVPNPDMFINFAATVVKDLDNYLYNN